jgi:queuosine precursor transporter
MVQEGLGQTAFERMNASSKLFVALAVVFTASLVIGDIIGGKSLDTPLGPISVGIIPFPVTFLLTDVVNDFYGRKGAKFLTWIGFFTALFAMLLIQLTTALPIASLASDSAYSQAEFAKIFGSSIRIFIGSLTAYMIGQFLDINVFQFWKTLTQSKHLWLRATGSTLLSQIVDTFCVNGIFWGGNQSVAWIVKKATREYGIKVVVAILLTPAVYALHTLIVRVLKIEPEHHAHAASKEPS